MESENWQCLDEMSLPESFMSHELDLPAITPAGFRGRSICCWPSLTLKSLAIDVYLWRGLFVRGGASANCCC